jgi:hypothetical protein
MGLSTSHQSQTGPRWPERVINCPGAGGQQGAATPEVKWSLYPRLNAKMFVTKQKTDTQLLYLKTYYELFVTLRAVI